MTIYHNIPNQWNSSYGRPSEVWFDWEFFGSPVNRNSRNQCTASSTFNIESAEPQPSVVQSFYPVNIILLDHSTIPEHTSIPEESKPLPSTS
ncbi:hypothetical protein WA026_022254 [Henosepilachna vigintioctopunctata]|uniref:Uncharacterized protein n=1 Tax=Henosepilachna vigintioctopunctata TaxID=420089 RepID=A0AAW1UQF1_9CUCU